MPNMWWGIINSYVFTKCYTVSFELQNWQHIIESHNQTHISKSHNCTWGNRVSLRLPQGSHLCCPASISGGCLLWVPFGWQNSVFSDGLLPSCSFPGLWTLWGLLYSRLTCPQLCGAVVDQKELYEWAKSLCTYIESWCFTCFCMGFFFLFFLDHFKRLSK